jgi:hypothetical protein
MRIWFALAAAFLAIHTAPALAERDPRSGAPLPPRKKREIPSPITDRFYVRGIFYSPAVSTNLHVDPHNAPAGTGTPLNAERDLGLDGRLHQGRMELMFRLRERNRLRVDYFESDRSANHVLARTIIFGNQTFTTNTKVTSDLNWRMFGLTYTYSVYRSEWLEIGTGLGVYFLQAEARGEAPSLNERQDVSGAGAFPTIPIDVAWRISSRWALTGRGQYLRVALHHFDGWLADVHEDVQYRWKPNFALGVGYTQIRAKVDLNTGNFPGGFFLNFRGPEAFFRVSF